MRIAKLFSAGCLGALVSIVSILTAFPISASAIGQRERLLLDFNWKFHLGDDWGLSEKLDKAGENPGPAGRNFSDAAWRTVNLPHDWVPELPFDPDAATDHGFKPVGPGFHSNSVGWYRRTFDLPSSDAGRRLMVQFDGVFRNCTVFFNGYLIGHHESGYNGFRYDVTDLANCGGRNTLAVRVDASQFEGWFYEGAGIYRHVWLLKMSPLHVAPDGTFVYSEFPNNTPDGGAAIVHAQTFINNMQSNAVAAELVGEIRDESGNLRAKFKKPVTIRPWQSTADFETVTVDSPALWSPETPHLYTLLTTIMADGLIVDQTSTEFGIRTVKFDPNEGFLLNGHQYEIKGTCNHQDHAGVGSALPDALQYFRVSRLKEMGCNAIRTSHNAPTPELLEACDRLGLLVMDENRLLGSDAATLARLKEQICRDRNHPSVFIWSLFNEESQQRTAAAARVTETMQRTVHELDPTRLCTAAGNVGNVFEGVNSVLDVRGWNYYPTEVDFYHKEHPQQPEIGTEQGSTVSTRGIYANDKERGYVSAYDDNAPPWATTAEKWWTIFAERPWLSGGFVWTGFDYRGEPTPYRWPCISSHFGIMDTCGFAKDNFYYYQAWWSDRTVLHLLPHWTWPGREGDDIDVRCYSNCEEVELFLNGHSLGRLPVPRNSHLQWTVKYEPGILMAKGYRHGKVIAERMIETTTMPTAIQIVPNRTSILADGEDISIIKIAVIDSKGRIVPVAGNHIHFSLTGPGKIIGVGNGDPSCHEPDVFVPEQQNQVIALNDWKMTRIEKTARHPHEVAEDFDDSQWDKVDVKADSGPLSPDENAVYRTAFLVSPAMLAAPAVTVSFGMIDDDGWVYVNGKPVGESHDWTGQPSFEVHKQLHAGKNVIAVSVRNKEGAGGVNKGVHLDVAEPPLPVDWQRSVFNGLAQVIVQSTQEPGTLDFTATGDGLTAASAQITTTGGDFRPVVP